VRFRDRFHPLRAHSRIRRDQSLWGGALKELRTCDLLAGTRAACRGRESDAASWLQQSKQAFPDVRGCAVVPCMCILLSPRCSYPPWLSAPFFYGLARALGDDLFGSPADGSPPRSCSFSVQPSVLWPLAGNHRANPFLRLVQWAVALAVCATAEFILARDRAGRCFCEFAPDLSGLALPTLNSTTFIMDTAQVLG